MYVYVYVCMYMCICMYVYVYICMYVYMYVCMYVYVYMYVCMYVYMYVCMYVYVCYSYSKQRSSRHTAMQRHFFSVDWGKFGVKIIRILISVPQCSAYRDFNFSHV